MRTMTIPSIGFSITDSAGKVLFSSQCGGSLSVEITGPASASEIQEANAINLAIDEARQLEADTKPAPAATSKGGRL